MKTYFVSYCFSPRGFGSCEIFMDKEIETYADIQEIVKSIENNNGLTEVIILNYKKLKRPSREEKK